MSILAESSVDLLAGLPELPSRTRPGGPARGERLRAVAAPAAAASAHAVRHRRGRRCGAHRRGADGAVDPPTQTSYELSALTSQQRDLDWQKQMLQDDVAGLSSPQYLAANAQAMGMLTGARRRRTCA